MKKTNKSINLLGPGTDLAITLLGVLLLIIAINEKLRDQQEAHIQFIKEEQKQLIEDLASEYKKSTYRSLEDDKTFHLYFDSTNVDKEQPNIVFYNDATLQRIRFSDEILFKLGKYEIEKESAKETLTKVGNKIFKRIASIKEIIIEGHTDNIPIDPSANVKSNLHLGLERALAVFNFLVSKTQLNPNKHLISASTYGEFKPVERNDKDTSYNTTKIEQNNNNKTKRALNRRIDIYLNYRGKKE